MRLIRVVTSMERVLKRAVPVALVMTADDERIPLTTAGRRAVDVRLHGFRDGVALVSTHERMAAGADDLGLVYRQGAVVGGVVDVDARGAVLSICWRKSREGRAVARAYADAAIRYRGGRVRRRRPRTVVAR